MTNVVSAVGFTSDCAHCNFLAKYVHVTTPEAYGSTEGFIREDTPFNPILLMRFRAPPAT